MLKIATIDVVLCRPMRLRRLHAATTRYTAFLGVFVLVLTRDQIDEKGNASSLANAYAIRESESIEEHPVKNCTRITKNHIIVPPSLPPALRKICAAGIPVGLLIILSRSVVQKQNVTVRIHPSTAEIVTACRMARGPSIAALCISSLRCVVPS